MATITGLTADRMQQIIDKTIVTANIVSGHLILTLTDGSTIDAGPAQGAPGAPGTGVGKGGAFPVAPSEGDLFIRTDQSGDPMYKYVAGTWVSAGGGLNKVTSFPVSPQDGDVVVRTDLNGSPLYAYSTENGWEPQPRMGAVTVPSVKVRRTTSQAIPTATSTVVSLDTIDHNTDGIFTIATPTRLTFKTPGLYLVSANVEWQIVAGGARNAWMQVNGNALDRVVDTMLDVAGAGESRQTLSGVRRFAAGDYIELAVYQTTGAPLNLVAGTNQSNLISATWLGGPGQTVDERGVSTVRATQTASQSIPNATDTLLTLETEDFDTEGMHDLVVNNTRVTIKTTGLYHVSAFLELFPNFTGFRQLLVKLNGANSPLPIHRVYPPNASDDSYLQTAGIVKLNAGDYLELSAYQTSGAALSTRASGAFLSAVLIGAARTVTPFVRAEGDGTTTISVPDQVTTIIPFQTETSDNDSMHDLVTNNGRLTCRTAGTYIILAGVSWAANNTGVRFLTLHKNGSGLNGATTTLHPNSSTMNADQIVMTILDLAVGDYVEAFVWQNSGAARSVTNAPQVLSAVKVGSPSSPSAALPTPQADVYTVATLPPAASFPNGRIVGVSDGAAGQQARMAMNGAWINLG